MFRNLAKTLMILARTAAPLILLLAGAASLVYGFAYHAAVVSVEQEIEIDLAPPPGMGMHGGMDFHPEPSLEPPGFGPPSESSGDPWLGGPPPWMAPPPELLTIKDMVILSEETTESQLIREVTFGGVRLDRGMLWRTYTGAPPLLCPT
jgi:hypothetical protein